MSCHVVGDEVITAIVRTGLRFGMGSLSTASLTGQALLAENIASVSFKYPEDLHTMMLSGPMGMRAPIVFPREDFRCYTQTPGYTYPPRLPDEPALHPGRVLKALGTYVYNSCEHFTWQASAAAEYIATLNHRIERAGYALSHQTLRDVPGLARYYVDPPEVDPDEEALAATADLEGDLPEEGD